MRHNLHTTPHAAPGPLLFEWTPHPDGGPGLPASIVAVLAEAGVGVGVGIDNPPEDCGAATLVLRLDGASAAPVRGAAVAPSASDGRWRLDVEGATPQQLRGDDALAAPCKGSS